MTCSTSRMLPVLLLAGIARTFSRSSGIAAAAAGTPSSLRKSRRSTEPMTELLGWVRGQGDVPVRTLSPAGASSSPAKAITREQVVSLRRRQREGSVEDGSGAQPEQRPRGRHDLVLRQEDMVSRRSERDEAVGAGDAGDPAGPLGVDQHGDDRL